jgi:hypothetical protein
VGPRTDLDVMEKKSFPCREWNSGLRVRSHRYPGSKYFSEWLETSDVTEHELGIRRDGARLVVSVRSPFQTLILFMLRERRGGCAEGKFHRDANAADCLAERVRCHREREL